MSNSVNNVIRVPCKLSSNFFYCWLTFLTPVHKLTPSVIKVASEILKHRYELSKSISDDDILDKYLMTNEEIRDAIIKECGISLSNYHVSIGKLRQTGFFINNKVNPRLIPKIKEDSSACNLMILFSLEDEQK